MSENMTRRQFERVSRAGMDVAAAAVRIGNSRKMSPEALLLIAVAMFVADVKCMSCREEYIRSIVDGIRRHCARVPLTFDCADTCEHARGLDQ
jgi:hypothetical protein